MQAERITSFAEFWPFYLREHARPATRTLHYVGTTLVILIALAAIATGRWWLLAAMPAAGYIFAWIAHFAIEKNRPATFTYPLWSLAADFLMCGYWISGRLDRELAQAGSFAADPTEQSAAQSLDSETRNNATGSGPDVCTEIVPLRDGPATR